MGTPDDAIAVKLVAALRQLFQDDAFLLAVDASTGWHTYGSRYNWIILAILILAGWGAAKLIRRA